MSGKNYFYRVYGWLFLLYLSILPISNTIALRNVALLLLSCATAWVFVFNRGLLQLPLRTAVASIPPVLWVWTAFLFVFPLWAPEGSVAWANLGGQWVESLLAWLVAFGCVVILGRRGPGLWLLAVASAFPVFLHLAMSFAAWGGIFVNPFPEEVTITKLWGYAFNQLTEHGWVRQGFPWGFRGLEPMHGNLGYTACQALALFGACFFSAVHSGAKRSLVWSIIGMLLCFSSILIANSRGAVLFGALLLIAMAALYFLRLSRRSVASQGHGIGFWWAGIAIALILFLAFAYQSVRFDSRWHSMLDKVEIGLSTTDPIDVLCNGVPPELKDRIKRDFSRGDPLYADDLIAGLEGQDGGRILLMRAGLRLVIETPWGLDGSRHSFKKLIEAKCGHTPALQFAHSHQGWVDIALAFGWVGLCIFLCLLAYFVRVGLRGLADEKYWPFALALLGISVFWMLRGFADSVYREHYLQMQAVLLLFLSLRTRLRL